MDAFAQDLISLLRYLLPGFLAAWVFYGLTSYEKPSQFERVIQALILTLMIEAVVRVEVAALSRLSEATDAFLRTGDGRLYPSLGTALLVGVLFAYFANRDVLHQLVRRLGLSRETSYPSEWFGAFLQNVTYVVLHMKDERRLYGWPRERPTRATS